MNKQSLRNLIATSQLKEQHRMLREAFPDLGPKPEASAIAARAKELKESVSIVKRLITSHNVNWSPRRFAGQEADPFDAWERGQDESPLSFREALMSNDATIVFKRVISDVLLTPIETPYIWQDLFAKTIQIDGTVKSAIFPALGAIVASDIGEGQEYPEQDPSFIEHGIELKVKKSGLKLAISEDLIDDSQWDIFGLYVTMAGHAMRRWKEQKIANEANFRGITFFDNLASGSSNWTTGIDANGNPNATFDMHDMFELIAGLIANGYNATDLIMHPLMWVTFAQDPRLLFQMLMNSSTGRSMPNPGLTPQDVQKNVPFGGITVNISPQATFEYDQSYTFQSNNFTSHLGSIYVLDRQASLVVLQRERMHMDEFRNPERDIHQLKVAERYDVGALDQGRGIAVAKNIATAQNHKPVFNVGQGPGVA